MTHPSPREHEVLDLMLEGLRNNAIAKRMGLSESTVKQYVNRLYKKYGIDGDQYTGRVHLVVEVLYRRRPDLIPFNGGDRASQLGFMSAQEYGANKLKHKPVYGGLAQL